MSDAGPGPILLISASAGSGKTHRLVNELEQAITRADNPVRPEGVVATTFTVKAAAELRERVRSRLLEAGHVEKAHRLGAARIGTVNAICGQLVTEFALELGISPETQVLDEAAAEEVFQRALSSVVGASSKGDEDDASPAVTGDASAALTELKERWERLDWPQDVRTIASRARANAMTADMLRDAAKRSIDGLLGHFGPVAPTGVALEQKLHRALTDFAPPAVDTTKDTLSLVSLVGHTESRLKAGRRVSWCDWARLAGARPGAKSRDLVEPVREAARGHEQHPLLREDVRACITLVFELAAQAIQAYADHKRVWGVMDFIDQEVKALELLRRPEVQDILREQIDLVLVDEFQDTSPLQLDIFLALSRLAPSSVWVGDQKQAIFGFRGTDPALMDAALAALIERHGASAQKTLAHSYRSRPELVRLTSDVFAPAFKPYGIPSERVRLEPAPEVEAIPDTLGPVVEIWRLGGSVKDERSAALASAVRELIDDPQVLVRDVLTNEPRRVQRRDIAVLCRTHTNCERVTQALESHGIPAVRPRKGLMRSAEARIALAALHLWADPAQSLAAAELGRVLAHPDDEATWVAAVLEAPGKAFATLAEVIGVADAARRMPMAGPLEAFDAAIEAVGLREACLRWGRTAQRLGNLDVLRATAHRYVATCQVEGAAATVAGLVAHLRGLEEDEKDDQAVLTGSDAVFVGTLHSAKGLEWPVTVLYEIDSTHAPTAFGVHLESDRERFDFGDPLGGRWIRYWPDPYAPQSSTALHEKVKQGREHEAAVARETSEMLRLLYVGWTRAKDRLVLAGKPGKIVGSMIGLLSDQDGNALVVEPEPGVACAWAGRKVEPRIRSAEPTDVTALVPEPGAGYDAAGPREYPPASQNVSSVARTGTRGEVEQIGSPLFIQPPVEWIDLGSAVHAFFAADATGLESGERLAIARSVLERWSVHGAMRAEDLLAASDDLRGWTTRRVSAARAHREWPVRLRQENGTELVGYADLVLMGADRFDLVDYKCVGGNREEALLAAAGYAGQLWTYAEAIGKATGKRPAGCFVHLVAQGLVVAVSDQEL
jgi:ATP-dependent helicase/nuclease subunit A